jgi:hypothetical protein
MIAKSRRLFGQSRAQNQWKQSRMIRMNSTIRYALLAVVALAGALATTAPPALAVCCYEAGCDEFWLHRVLVNHGVENPGI